MTDIKKRAHGLPATSEARDVMAMAEKTGNIYKSLAVIARRSSQISALLKEELHSKLEEFASSTETLEEIHENKEQIEISKFYERLPNPPLIATHEFMEDQLDYHSKDEKKDEE